MKADFSRATAAGQTRFADLNSQGREEKEKQGNCRLRIAELLGMIIARTGMSGRFFCSDYIPQSAIRNFLILTGWR
jgi:hypothetical protein